MSFIYPCQIYSHHEYVYGHLFLIVIKAIAGIPLENFRGKETPFIMDISKQAVTVASCLWDESLGD